MLDLVVVDSPQSLQSRDRVKIGGRWDGGEGKLSRRVGTKEGLLKRNRLGEAAGGKLWERKRWEEPAAKLKTDPAAENPGRDLVREKRVKLVPQLVNTLSEERWVRSRRREGERRREEESSGRERGGRNQQPE